MPDLVAYLQTVPELTGGVHARKPATHPTGPHVIWEEGAESDRQPIFDPEGRKVAVCACAVSVFLYVPENLGRSAAVALYDQIVEAANVVDGWGDVGFLALRPSGPRIRPLWDGSSWTGVVRFTLLHVRT